MKFRQIKETCIYVKDLRSSEKFYSEVLGLEKISDVPDRHVFFRAGTSVLLLFNSEATAADEKLPPHFGEGKMHFAIEVEQKDYEKAKSEIKKHAISIEHEHEWKDGLKSFYFRDPDGHLVEIVPKGIWEKPE